MIITLKNLPESVAGFSAIGTVSHDDYQRVIIPAVEEKLKANGKLSLLYHIGPKYRHFSLGAAWDDLKIGIKHLRDWERIALVSDVRWIRACVRVVGWFMPAKVRLFDNAHFHDARDWVTG